MGEVCAAQGTDFFEVVPKSVVDAGAFLGGVFPGCRGPEVFVPEGPGAALQWSDGVDVAFDGMVGISGEEDAVF